MVTFRATATLRNLHLRFLTQSCQCLLLRSYVSGMIKYRILRHDSKDRFTSC